MELAGPTELGFPPTAQCTGLTAPSQAPTAHVPGHRPWSLCQSLCEAGRAPGCLDCTVLLSVRDCPCALQITAVMVTTMMATEV